MMSKENKNSKINEESKTEVSEKKFKFQNNSNGSSLSLAFYFFNSVAFLLVISIYTDKIRQMIPYWKAQSIWYRSILPSIIFVCIAFITNFLIFKWNHAKTTHPIKNKPIKRLAFIFILMNIIYQIQNKSLHYHPMRFMIGFSIGIQEETYFFIDSIHCLLVSLGLYFIFDFIFKFIFKKEECTKNHLR